MIVANLRSSTGTREELDEFVLRLGAIIEANDDSVGRNSMQVFGRFAAQPVCEGPDLDALKAETDPHVIRQLLLP